MALQGVGHHDELRAQITQLLNVIEAQARAANGLQKNAKTKRCNAAIQAAKNAQDTITAIQTANFLAFDDLDNVLHEFVLWIDLREETERIKNLAGEQFSDDVPVNWRDLEGYLVSIEVGILGLKTRAAARVALLAGRGHWRQTTLNETHEVDAMLFN